MAPTPTTGASVSAASTTIGGSVPPSSHCETGASLPSTGVHAAADGNVTRKAHRQDLEQVSPAADAATDGQPPAQDQVHHGKYAWDQGMRSSGQLQGIGDGKYAFTSENGSVAVMTADEAEVAVQADLERQRNAPRIVEAVTADVDKSSETAQAAAAAIQLPEGWKRGQCATELGGLSLYDDQLRDIVNKTAFVLQRRTKLTGSYKVFLETTGIYVVATKLICADGSEQLHAIYLDCERDVVHFGYNDSGDDMISFLIEKPDRRDIVSAEANLLRRDNFPRNTENPGRTLAKIEIREVMQVMVKTKKLHAIPHVAYKLAATKRPLETAVGPNKRPRD